jgi:CRP-like cAMP-binding protein
LTGSLDSAALLPILRRVDLFAGVEESALQELVGTGRLRRFPADRLIVRQGEYGDELFVVLEGRVVVQVAGDDGRMRDLAQLGPGQYFGELAMVGHGERVASVRSNTQVEVLELRQGAFQQVLRKFKQVRARLEEAYAVRALGTFVRRCRFFHHLPESSLDELLAAASLTGHKKGDQIVAEGSPAQRFFVVKSGFVRLSRQVPGTDRDEVVAYLGPEDFFGDQELASATPTWATTVIALEPVEVMSLPRVAFWKLHQKHPDLFTAFRRYQIARAEQQQILAGSATAMAFVQTMMESGLAQARSALIINLESCVRCGNCVQACDDLHGYSRIARRGKKLTRRIEQDRRAHESLYFPTSCLQCATPECMVGCPTGAISRDTGGEVFIRDTCIGCGNCARNCDFGNISMARAKVEEPSIVEMILGKAQDPSRAPKSELVAVKCDVCFDRNHAACVYNCPTQAILRIDPRIYFAELRAVAPKAFLAEAGGAKTTAQRPRQGVGALLQLLVVAAAVAGGFVAWERLSLPGAWGYSGYGWWSGVASAAVMGLLASIGARKRLRTVALGPLSRWVSLHGALGGVFLGLVLFHAGFRATSTLTTMLLAAIVLSVVLGLTGSLVSSWLPRLITRVQDEAILPEDVAPRVAALEQENDDLLGALDAASRGRVSRLAQRITPSASAALRHGLSPQRAVAYLEARAKNLPVIAEHEHAIALRVAGNLHELRVRRAQELMELVLRGWGPLHLVTSCVALLLLVGHVMTVALW